MNKDNIFAKMIIFHVICTKICTFQYVVKSNVQPALASSFAVEHFLFSYIEMIIIFLKCENV